MNNDTAEFIQNLLMLADKFLKQKMSASAMPSHDTAAHVSKPGALPTQSMAQEDLREMLNTLMNVVKSLNAQVDKIDSRLVSLERALGLQEEPVKTQTAARAEPSKPEQQVTAH
jgi:hypothetical protein